MEKTTEQIVKERAKACADSAKRRIDAYIDKAFFTGAFDLDYAYENGNTIPNAIVLAALKAAVDDMNGISNEVRNEGTNIYFNL